MSDEQQLGQSAKRRYSHARKLPLTGVRVFDVTSTYAGPTCGRVLADLGADVIHVEGVKRIDRVRMLVTADNKVGEDYWNWGAYFMKRNVGKKGLSINLDEREGRDAALKIISRCDVLLESFAPRVMPNLGLDYESVRKVRPDIVYCSLSGYGQSGPCRDWLAYGMGLEPASGISSLTGYPDGDPLRSGISLTDPYSGLMAAFAVLVALDHRRRTGRGQYIDLSEQEAAIPMVGRALLDYLVTGNAWQRIGNRSRDAAPQGVYPCRGDDEWVAISVSSDTEWRALAELLGRDEWQRDTELASAAGRFTRHAELDAVISDWTRARDKREAMETLQRASVTTGAVLNAKDLLQNEHLRARAHFDVVDHPRAGRRPLPRQLPVKFSRFEAAARGAAPLLGEHNREVLSDVGGLTEEEIDRLEEGNVIGRQPDPPLPVNIVRDAVLTPIETLLQAGAILRFEPEYREHIRDLYE